MTLLFGELHTDKWLSNKPDILPFSTYDLFYCSIALLRFIMLLLCFN